MLLLAAAPAALNATAAAPTAAPNATSARRLEAVEWPLRRAGGRRHAPPSPSPLVERLPSSERYCYPLPPNEPVARSGQIGDGTAFGTALHALASRPEVLRALELGTWYGGGSSVSLSRGLSLSWKASLARSLALSGDTENCEERGGERCCHSLLVTLEVYEPAWQHARRFLRDLPVHCILGSTVHAEEMLQPHEIPRHERTEHFRLYYNRDARLMRKMEPQLARLCARYQFELVLIDGNEYTGWAEFNHVRKECKPKYLALHDTNTLKTAKIEEYLAAHHDEYVLYLKKGHTDTMRPGCELVGCKPDHMFVPNAAGFSIYKRVDPSDEPPQGSAPGEKPVLKEFKPKRAGLKAKLEQLKATVSALRSELTSHRGTTR
ncbi:hypothetical protein AB1Y20_008916 [Prymnesium parvum]|uniref:Uncharacterized protein n=1 Tax=Prymnesium parvum TaxID=97485 RepID=A0AB34JZX5_PRYPA